MEPDAIQPGMIVKQRHGSQPLVVLWIDETGEAVQCRWLDGMDWREASFQIADLEEAEGRS